MSTWTRFRIAFRLALVVTWTLSCFLVRMAVYPARWVWPAAEWRMRRVIFRTWARVILRILHVTVIVEGTPPRPPCFTVSNHLSNLDLILVTSRLGERFVSRADAAQWPLIGKIITLMDTIYIDRSKRRDTRRVNDLIGGALDRGHGVHVFAESRISQDARVHPFKPALLEPAVAQGCPVHYITLSYATPEGSPPAADVVVWKSGVSLAQNALSVLALPRVYASVHFGEEPVTAANRKQLAERLYEAVSKDFEPLDSWMEREGTAP